MCPSIQNFQKPQKKELRSQLHLHKLHKGVVYIKQYILGIPAESSREQKAPVSGYFQALDLKNATYKCKLYYIYSIYIFFIDCKWIYKRHIYI